MKLQRVRLLVMVFSMVVALPVSALRAAYIETFSNPPSTEGWIAQGASQSNPGAGGNPGGYLQSSNAVAAYPWVAPDDGASGGNFQGDIWTKQGNSLTFSFDVAILSPGTSFDSFRLFFYKVGQYPNYWKYSWTGLNIDSSSGWVHLSVPLDKSWDDATYLANGWTKNASPSSFVDVLSNIGPQYDIQATPGHFTSGGTNIAGFDNVSWTAVPEPASVSLLLFGFVGMSWQAMRRRR